ncbi:hypothetical protein AKO1_003219 [Acrasis kona]|uniref:Uncharacterized protein n=1 Tax=Acrasis kona TaxID=1008807 RepID=A0AAW2ZM72_9EUKA
MESIYRFFELDKDDGTRKNKILRRITNLLVVLSKFVYAYVFIKTFLGFVLPKRTHKVRHSTNHTPTINHINSNPYRREEHRNIQASYDQALQYYEHYVSASGLPTFPEFLVKEEMGLDSLRSTTRQNNRRS